MIGDLQILGALRTLSRKVASPHERLARVAADLDRLYLDLDEPMQGIMEWPDNRCEGQLLFNPTRLPDPSASSRGPSGSIFEQVTLGTRRLGPYDYTLLIQLIGERVQMQLGYRTDLFRCETATGLALLIVEEASRLLHHVSSQDPSWSADELNRAKRT